MINVKLLVATLYIFRTYYFRVHFPTIVFANQLSSSKDLSAFQRILVCAMKKDYGSIKR